MKEVGNRGAFTILELLITLVALSCLAALAIPAFFSQPEVTLEKAAILLAKDLRMAQNHSAYAAEPNRFEFLPDGDGYRVVDPDGRVIEHPATLQPFVRRYSEDAVFRGVEIADLVAPDEHAVTYDTRGRPDGEVRVTLSFEGDLRYVRITGQQGIIEILGSTSGWIDDLR